MTWQCLYKVVDVLDISSTPVDSNNTTSIRYRLMKTLIAEICPILLRNLGCCEEGRTT